MPDYEVVTTTTLYKYNADRNRWETSGRKLAGERIPDLTEITTEINGETVRLFASGVDAIPENCIQLVGAPVPPPPQPPVVVPPIIIPPQPLPNDTAYATVIEPDGAPIHAAADYYAPQIRIARLGENFIVDRQTIDAQGIRWLEIADGADKGHYLYLSTVPRVSVT